MIVSLLPRGFALLWKTFWTGLIFSRFATSLRFRFVHEHLVTERTLTPVIQVPLLSYSALVASSLEELLVVVDELASLFNSTLAVFLLPSR